MRARVGHIRFLNCFPVLYGLRALKALPHVELVQGTPAQLNRMLINKELDLTPISSIEYARHAHDVLLVPDISISCDGRVMSILLFSKFPITELGGRRIALTNTSATSHVLLRILLQRKYGLQTEYLVAEPELDSMLLEADAALLIGDDAMRSNQQMEGKLFVYDLGQEWKDYTGEAMVCAVWAVHRDFVRDHPEEAALVQKALVNSVRYSLNRTQEVAQAAVNGGSFTAQFLEEYFSVLDFGFDDRLQRGLRRYYEEAHSIGALTDVPSLEFVEV